MPMVRAMRLLNAIEAGTLTGTQLEALLVADPGRLAELYVLLLLPGQIRRIAASSTSMTAVAGSSTAMDAVIASSTAMTAVIASSTAMTAVAASSTAMTAVIASSIARNAVYNSDAALNAISASSTAIAALASSPQYQTKTGINCASTAQAIGFTAPAIIIKLSQSWGNYPSYNMVIGNLRAGTSISGIKTLGAPPGGAYNATANVPGNTWVLPAQASATQNNSYTSLGAVLNIGFIYV